MKPSKHSNEKNLKHLVIISCFIFFLFCLILIQYYYLQIIEGKKWRKIANSQHQIEVIEHFKRGGFYSNTEIKKDHIFQKVPFVMEITKYHLFVDPVSIDKKYKLDIAKAIFSFFNLSKEEKENLFESFYKKSRSRKLISWIDKNQKEKILKWWNKYSKEKKIAKNALFFESDYKRSYPFGSLLSQTLQTVQLQKDPKTFQSIPTGGLEFYFNDYLKGSLGKKTVTRSTRHSLDTGKVIHKPEDGADIYLTVNHYLQAIAEEELEKGKIIANAKCAWAIMMDPYTGEILALAQSPKLDLKRYGEYYQDEKLKEFTKLKALSDPYETGSVMKPITLAICLKANEDLLKENKKTFFDPFEKMSTSNGNFPGRSTPMKDGRKHNYLNMYLAIQKSSNIYFATIIDKLISVFGEKWYRDSLVDIFGFSKKTGIELPGEEPGFLPELGRNYANNKPQWSKSTPYSLSRGYNLLVNSFQMIKAYGIIANGGIDVKPTLLKKIVKKINDTETTIIDNTKSYKLNKRVISKDICQNVKQCMKFTTKMGGTSPLGDIYGYTEAGKSGTAEKMVDGKYRKDVHISSFIGMVPVEKPKFVLLVVVDEPEKKYVKGLGSMQYGGVCAAPIFKEISSRSLKYLGVAPDDPYGYPPLDPRRDPDKADLFKELKYLSELYKLWNGG